MNNITIIPYKKEEHEEMIKGWATKRNLIFLPILLSPQGFIVTDNNEPVLAVWVYHILDVPIIQLDNLISKPNTGLKPMKEYFIKLLNFIKSYIEQVEKLSNCKFFMIRCFINKRLESWAKSAGFNIDANDGVICRLILG